MDCRLYHNPACSKSRATLELLRERGVEPEIVEYLKQPPSVDALRELVGLLGIAPRDLLRTGEAVYAELGLDDASLDDEGSGPGWKRAGSSRWWTTRPCCVRWPRIHG